MDYFTANAGYTVLLDEASGILRISREGEPTRVVHASALAYGEEWTLESAIAEVGGDLEIDPSTGCAIVGPKRSAPAPRVSPDVRARSAAAALEALAELEAAAHEDPPELELEPEAPVYEFADGARVEASPGLPVLVPALRPCGCGSRGRHRADCPTRKIAAA